MKLAGFPDSAVAVVFVVWKYACCVLCVCAGSCQPIESCEDEGACVVTVHYL